MSRSFPTVEKLEFEHAGYTLKDGERRALKLLAPWDLVVHTDPRPTLAITGDPSISLLESDSVFGFDHQRECGICIVYAKGRRVGAKARVVATLGESVAESELAVSVGGVSGVNISFEEMNIEQRAIIDGSALKINARHPAIARYLGPKRKNWPGQNAVHFRTMLAEIIAWAFARHVVQQRLHQDRQDVYRLFYEHMQLMDKWLPRLHGMLVPARELALPADH